MGVDYGWVNVPLHCSVVFGLPFDDDLDLIRESAADTAFHFATVHSCWLVRRS